jgi:hypothetical protein
MNTRTHRDVSSGRTTAPSGARSERYYELGAMTVRQLERTLVRGATPDPAGLAGWEFCGMNHPAWARLIGIKKFIKGFYLRDGALWGYNTPVGQNGVRQPWIARPRDDQPKRFGFYRVDRVDPTADDNEYLHAVLLDYGRGGNRRLDPTSGLRDYLVQVDIDNPDLFLGKAYYRVGPIAVATSFFILERYRRGLPAISDA